MITNKLLKKFKSKHPDINISSANLTGINGAFDLFHDNRKVVRSDTEAYFKNEVVLIQTQILSLGSLISYCQNSMETTNRVLSANFPFKDIHLASILTNISNTAQCIYELCLNGFNVQAEVLYRTLLERTMQGIVLLNNADDMEHWLSAQDASASKKADFELFAKKERLYKKYEAIERELLQVTPNSQELRKHRKGKMDNVSPAVHGASVPVTLGSFASWNENEVKSALFGSSCRTSASILDGVIFELWFFFVLLTRTLSKVHEWQRDYQEELVVGFELYRYTAHKLFEERNSEIMD